MRNLLSPEHELDRTFRWKWYWIPLAPGRTRNSNLLCNYTHGRVLVISLSHIWFLYRSIPYRDICMGNSWGGIFHGEFMGGGYFWWTQYQIIFKRLYQDYIIVVRSPENLFSALTITMYRFLLCIIMYPTLNHHNSVPYFEPSKLCTLLWTFKTLYPTLNLHNSVPYFEPSQLCTIFCTLVLFFVRCKFPPFNHIVHCT